MKHLLVIIMCAAPTTIQAQNTTVFNIPVVQVSANGQEARSFLLDSGTTKTALSHSFLEMARTRSALQKSNGKYLAHLDVAGRKAMAVDIRTAEFGSLSELLGLQLDGIIGLDVLLQLTFTINYPERSVVAVDSSEFKYAGDGLIIPVELAGGAMTQSLIQLTDSEKYGITMMIDTGCTDGIIIPANFFSLPELEPLLQTLTSPTRKALRLGQTLEVKQSTTAKCFALGGHIVDNPSISISTTLNTRYGLIGGAFLRPFVVHLDLRRNRVILEHSGKMIAADSPGDLGFGLKALAPAYRRYIVVEIDKNSGAESAGLLVNDEVISINNTELRNMDLQGVSDLVKRIRESGASVDAEVLREQRVLHIRVD